MKCRILLIVFIAGSIQGFSQNNSFTITADSIGDGTFYFGDKANWKFKAGDNLEWASPDYNDSDWIQLTPSGLRQPIADSLWQGNGWFRFTFKADSTLHKRIWNLYFYTSGAAEVYIDGQLKNTYGQFSTNPKLEKHFRFKGPFSVSFSIDPAEYHVIAVRYSYHKGADYYALLGKNAGYFGFGIGFENQKIFKNNIDNRESAIRALFISASMLLLMLILHSFLLFLMPRDKSNRYIVVVIALLFVHNLCGFSSLIWELNAMERFIIRDVAFMITSSLALALFPFSIATMFAQKIRLVYKLILGIAPFVAPIVLLTEIPNLVFLCGLSVLVLGCIIYILMKARREKQRGVGFVAFGFGGSLVIGIVLLISLEYALVSYRQIDLLITLFYITIPLSLTLLMAYRFYVLNTGLEATVVERTRELRQSLDSLKSTQSQLIQSEKMASLGELTAGIAHEIQNPLNFVNNFSELNQELIGEASEELKKGDLEETAAILKDLEENSEKITHHGKRADAIVKGMLAHSRSGKGEKVPTDLNVLAEEYLKLSYHGLRAKDKSFNADFKLDLDPDLPKVNVVPQDIGRVLLNLINNAFQAVNDRCKNVESGYKPEVSVETQLKTNNQICITIRDNGPGIPDAIKDKIFQPFFTTKPTGQGTGLGLSLSYDIVKAHGGELSTETIEGKGAIFIIHLPKD